MRENVHGSINKMTGIYKIADKTIEIVSLHENVHTLCKDYIYEGVPDFSVKTEQKDIDFERMHSSEEEYAASFSDGYLETLAVYRKIAEKMLEYDTILLHGSCIAVDGKAYIFTAKSGTGKSTHVSLWKKHFGEDVRIINGDKPILRFIDGRLYAFGTPWCGKECWHTNGFVPLKAICFLERASENTIRKIEPKEAIGRIFHQLLTPEDLSTVDALFPLLDRMLREVPCYLLGCNVSEEAAEVAYKGMNQSFT